MRTTLIGAMMAGAMLLMGGAASAQTYTGTVYGSGTGANCSRYKMTMDVVVAGTQVQGTFQQDKGLKDERPQRNFAATADGVGNFKAVAMLGEGNKMSVAGSAKPNEVRVKLDGYCVFDAKLAPRK